MTDSATAPRPVGRPNKYNFGSMDIDDTFKIDDSTKRLSVYQSSRSWSICRGLDRKFAVYKAKDGHYYCVRTR